MEYYLDEQLKAYFEEQITKASSKKVAKLRQELDERRERELARMRDEVKRQVDLSLGFELKEIKSQSREDINLLLSRMHLELMQKREALVKQLFDEATEKIKAFVSSKPYVALMQDKLQHICKSYKDCQFVFTIAPHDAQLSALIPTICPQGSIQTSPTIRLGGFSCYLPERKIQIDETLDHRLDEQKVWFYQQSKLFVKE